MDDMALLHEYADHNSEAAFETLVSRRVNFVYSAALRQVRNADLAGEVTQAVFVLLAQKAGKIPPQTVLTGWLFKTTHFVALAQIRAAARRQRHDQEIQMQAELQDPTPPAADEIWEQMSPLLDEALAALGESDRQAVLLRFFENKPLAEVGNILGTGEDTARKRVSRALEKLHRFFGRRGVSLTTAILAGTISANSVQAAPAAVANSAAAAAVAKGAAVSSSTITLIQGALKLMTLAKLKTAALVGTAVLLVGSTTTLVVKEVRAQSTEEPTIDESLWKPDARVLQKAPEVLVIRPTKFPGSGCRLDAGNKILMIDTSLQGLLSAAYGFPEASIILPESLPPTRYDLMLTLPEHPREMLQAEIRKRFGLVGHSEDRETDVFAMKIKNPDARGLSRSSGGGSQSMSSSMVSAAGPVPPEVAAKIQGTSRPDSSGSTIIRNQTMSDLARYFEKMLGRRVVDQTGLTNRFDFKFQAQPEGHESREDAIKRAALAQLGLELVPERETVKMLVVEKSNDHP